MKKYFNVTYLAPASLVAAMIGFLLTLKSPHEAVRIAHAFFEAAMIGGLADWFAVVALFRHPMNLPIPHTSIIKKNRVKITGKIVDMLETQWLTREAIQRKLEGVDFAAQVAAMANDPASSGQIKSLADDLAERAVNGIKNSQEAIMEVIAAVNEKIKGVDFVGPLTLSLEGNYDNFRTLLLNEAESWIVMPETNFVVADKIKKIVLSYSEKYEIVKTAVDFGEMIGVLNYESIAAELVRAMQTEIGEARFDPSHEICRQLNRSFGNMIEKLRGNEKLTALPNALFGAAVNKLDIPALIASHAEAKKPAIADFLAETAKTAAGEIGTGGAKKDAFNEWARARLLELLDKYHPEIGQIVKENIEAINDDDLVEQIEDRVGEDLQYIRINGAIVGGLVGTLIFVAKNYLLKI